MRSPSAATGSPSAAPLPIVYDLELNPQEFPFPTDFNDVRGLRWGNDGRLLGWNSTTAWVVGGGEPLSFSLDAQGLDVPDDSISAPNGSQRSAGSPSAPLTRSTPGSPKAAALSR